MRIEFAKPIVSVQPLGDARFSVLISEPGKASIEFVAGEAAALKIVDEIENAVQDWNRTGDDGGDQREHEHASSNTTFAEFSRRNYLRCVASDGFNHELKAWSLSDWMTAAVGELGEAANIAKKLNRIRDGVPGNRELETAAELHVRLRRELADAYIYLDLLAQAENIDLGDAVLDTFDAKSKEIGYNG